MSDIEFLNNTYPEEWYSGVLGNVSDFLDGKRIPLKQSDRDDMQGHIPYYGASGIIDYVNDYIFNDELILVGEDGENVVSRNLPLAFRVSGKCWVNNHAHVLKPKDNYDLDYLTYYLEFQNYKPLVSGSAQPKLTQVALYNLSVFSPSLGQQQKISMILNTADNLIKETQNLIDKYTAVKNGMMTDLFTRGINLTGSPETNKNYSQLRPSVKDAPELYKDTELGWIPIDWDIHKIEDILNRIIDYRGKTPTKTDSGVPLITAKNVRFGYIDPEPREFIASNDYDSWMTRGIPNQGDVLFTTEAPLANVAQIETEDKVAFAQRMIILQTNTACDSTFLKYLLMSENFRRTIFSRGSGSTVEGVKQSEFKKVRVCLPKSNEEQIQIVKMIDSLTKKIVSEESAMSKSKEIKKGLMQDLLTGKVKV